jgi:hypothetical protein
VRRYTAVCLADCEMKVLAREAVAREVVGARVEGLGGVVARLRGVDYFRELPQGCFYRLACLA